MNGRSRAYDYFRLGLAREWHSQVSDLVLCQVPQALLAALPHVAEHLSLKHYQRAAWALGGCPVGAAHCALPGVSRGHRCTASFAPRARLPLARPHPLPKTGSRPPHSPGPLLWGCTGLSGDYIDELLPQAVASLRSLAATAGYKATGQETKESFKKPFQCARRTTSILHTQRHARTTPQMVVRTRVFESFLDQGARKSVLVPGCSYGCRPERIVEPAVVPQCNILGCPSGRAPTEASDRAFP